MSSLTNTRIPASGDNDFKDRCSACSKKVGEDKLRKCPKCEMVRYCSRACQRSAMKAHKPRCLQGQSFAEALAKDKELEALNAAFSKWLDCWRNTINHYALCAHDLANHPQDRLATHCFVLEVKQRPNAPSVAQSFKMVAGKVASRDELVEILREMGGSEEQVDHWRKDYRGEDTVHTVIIFDAGTARFLWYCLGDLTQYRSDPIASRKLAEGCWTGLTYSFETGKGAITMPISMP